MWKPDMHSTASLSSEYIYLTKPSIFFWKHLSSLLPFENFTFVHFLFLFSITEKQISAEKLYIRNLKEKYSCVDEFMEV